TVSAVAGTYQHETSDVAGSTSAGSTGGTLHGTTLGATAMSTNTSTGPVDFTGVTAFGGNGVTVTSDVTQSTSASLGGTIILTGAATLGASSHLEPDEPHGHGLRSHRLCAQPRRRASRRHHRRRGRLRTRRGRLARRH